LDSTDRVVSSLSRGAIGGGWANAEVQPGTNVSFLVAIMVSVYFFINNS